jgi:hypothetical protein
MSTCDVQKFKKLCQTFITYYENEDFKESTLTRLLTDLNYMYKN